MNREHELTTADLAQASERDHREDLRGKREEHVEGRARPDSPTVGDARRPSATQTRRDVTDAAAGRSDGPRETQAALFAVEEATRFHNRWTEVQSGFVDEPRVAVERADSLVAEVMKKLAEGFAHERDVLEHQWDRDGNVTTEDLRVALQRYRSFFDRLLKI
jgi:hypothetical protein